MDAHGIFYVGTARPKPGKAAEAAGWWDEEGHALYSSLPGVSSLRSYASQFGLGGEYGIEFWFELENYAVLDQWNDVMAAEPQKYGPMFQKFFDLFEPGPSRVVGDWPD